MILVVLLFTYGEPTFVLAFPIAMLLLSITTFLIIARTFEHMASSPLRVLDDLINRVERAIMHLQISVKGLEEEFKSLRLLVQTIALKDAVGAILRTVIASSRKARLSILGPLVSIAYSLFKLLGLT